MVHVYCYDHATSSFPREARHVLRCGRRATLGSVRRSIQELFAAELGAGDGAFQLFTVDNDGELSELRARAHPRTRSPGIPHFTPCLPGFLPRYLRYVPYYTRFSRMIVARSDIDEF